jgi:hypothetical protein
VKVMDSNCKNFVNILETPLAIDELEEFGK